MKSHTQTLLDELERDGVIVRNGKMRRNPETGELQPVYVLAPGYADHLNRTEAELLGFTEWPATFTRKDA